LALSENHSSPFTMSRTLSRGKKAPCRIYSPAWRFPSHPRRGSHGVSSDARNSQFTIRPWRLLAGHFVATAGAFPWTVHSCVAGAAWMRSQKGNVGFCPDGLEVLLRRGGSAVMWPAPTRRPPRPCGRSPRPSSRARAPWRSSPCWGSSCARRGRPSCRPGAAFP